MHYGQRKARKCVICSDCNPGHQIVSLLPVGWLINTRNELSEVGVICKLQDLDRLMTGGPVVGAEEKGRSLWSILCCWSRSNNFPPSCTASCQTRSQWSTCKWSQASWAWRTGVEAEVGWWYWMQSWSLQTGSWHRFQVQWHPLASGFKICPEWFDDNRTPLHMSLHASQVATGD